MKSRRFLQWAVLLALLGLIAGSAGGADQPVKKKKKSTASKKVAAKILTQCLVRGKDGVWKPAIAKETVGYGDVVLGGYGASLVNPKGTVQLTMLGDLSALSPYPIIETSVVFNPAAEAGIDLECTLDRGRIDLLNRKKAGSAWVRVHVQKEVIDLVLSEPQSRVALEEYGRWPGGAPFKKDPGPGYGPQFDLTVQVLKGQVDFKSGGRQFSLEAPPGPASIEWDSGRGWDPSPTRQQKLPVWADPTAGDTPEGKLKKQTLARFRSKARKQGLEPVLEEYLNSEDPEQRRIAVFVLGATDNLEKIGEVLNKTKHADVWENAVLVLRHWIGRGPDQDQSLYKTLLKKLPPAHAGTIMHLLHGFGETELSQPETYEVLIEYLGHEVLGIRGLAWWHLTRLVPAGHSIKYSPLDPPEERAKAQAGWRKLIPSGKLPPSAASGSLK